MNIVVATAHNIAGRSHLFDAIWAIFDGSSGGLADADTEPMARGKVFVTEHVKDYVVSWFLFPAAILLLIILAGRAHTRYLDRLQADPERQLMLGVSFAICSDEAVPPPRAASTGDAGSQLNLERRAFSPDVGSRRPGNPRRQFARSARSRSEARDVRDT